MANTLVSNISMRALLAAACGLVLSATGCTTETDAADEEFVGSAQVTLVEVPAGIQCVKLLAERYPDRFERTFPVSPGATAVLAFNGLPTGDMVFSGAAYTQRCPSVTANTAATWLADPVFTRIEPGPWSVANLRLVMRPAVTENISVDFFAQALRNGDFKLGLAGWNTFFDPWPFSVVACPGASRQRTCLTSLGDGVFGVVSQSFRVPQDATALRFAMSGMEGGAVRVALYRGTGTGGTLLKSAQGGDSAWSTVVPASWDLMGLRGETVTVAIEDNDWIGRVNTTGFDVIREKPAILVNGDFSNGLTGWTATGDGSRFSVSRDPNYNDVWTVSSFVQSPPHQGEAATGSLSQSFVVPDNAVALRFVVSGGAASTFCNVRLTDGKNFVHREVSGRNGNTAQKRAEPVSWDLTQLRGQTVSIVILDDNPNAGGWNFITTSGFDVITTTNGP